jgi:uncharacterized membrane protein YhiD involved in acid resistance
MLIGTGYVFLLVTVALLIYGIVKFFMWCVPSYSNCMENLKKRQFEHEKKINLDRVKELESKLKETKRREKVTIYKLDETKQQLDETKQQLSNVQQDIPIAHIAKPMTVEKGTGNHDIESQKS